MDNQFNPNFQYLDAGQDTLDNTWGGANVHYALISTFGRVLYNYDEKYLFSATLRRDGSSNFGPATSSVCSLLPRSVGSPPKKGSWKPSSRLAS